MQRMIPPEPRNSRLRLAFMQYPSSAQHSHIPEFFPFDILRRYNLTMTVHLNLPKEIEDLLAEEVRSGRHSSLEEAILEKLRQSDDTDVIGGMNKDDLRRDLDVAWNNREGAVSAQSVLDRLAAKSAALKAQGK